MNRDFKAIRLVSYLIYKSIFFSFYARGKFVLRQFKCSPYVWGKRINKLAKMRGY